MWNEMKLDKCIVYKSNFLFCAVYVDWTEKLISRLTESSENVTWILKINQVLWWRCWMCYADDKGCSCLPIVAIYNWINYFFFCSVCFVFLLNKMKKKKKVLMTFCRVLSTVDDILEDGLWINNLNWKWIEFVNNKWHLMST